MKKLPLLTASLLLVGIHLSAQTLEEALDLDSDLLTIELAGFEVTTTDTIDGEDAVVASISGSSEATIQLSARSLGSLSVQTDPRGATMYFEVQNGDSWQHLATSYFDPASSHVLLIVLRPEDVYRIRLKAAYGASPKVVVDQVSFVPIVEGNLAEAADTQLELRNRDNGGVWFSQTHDTIDGDALQVAPGRQSTEVYAQVEGPALLSFSWKLNTPTQSDSLSLRLGESNPELARQAVDQDGWVTESVMIPEGSHRLAWNYSNLSFSYSSDHSDSSSLAVFLDRISVTPLGEADLNEALDVDVVHFKTGTGEGWLRLGPELSTDEEDAIGVASFGEGEISVTPIEAVMEGPARVSFLWGSNATLRFMIGRTGGFGPEWAIAASQTGSEATWESAEVWVPPGTYNVEWGFSPIHYQPRYQTAWMDSVTVSPIETVSLGEALDAQDLQFDTGPEGYEWWGQTEDAFDFEDATVSAFLPRFGRSWIQTVVDGPGSLSYTWRSKAPSNSYPDADLILLDGALLPDGMEWSEVAEMSTPTQGSWNEFVYHVPEGRHQVAWLVERTVGSNAPALVNHYMLDRVRFTPQSTASPLRASVKVDDWMWSPWLEWYFGYSGSWIFHPEHGNLYLTGKSDSSVILYDPSLQSWCWTGEGAFPTFYRYSDSRWYSVDPGDGPGERWFYRMDNGEWIKEPQM